MLHSFHINTEVKEEPMFWRTRLSVLSLRPLLVAVFLSFFILGGMLREADAAPVSSTMPNRHEIDTYVMSQMQRLHLPGVALGIVHQNQVVYTQGYGVADPSGRPMTAHTPFVLASISKSFTALAIMQLAEQGKITLDAPVQRYIPWFQVATPGAASRITIRDLLIQTSGLSPYLGGIHPAEPHESIEHFVRAMRTTTLTAPVGTTFQYSNANYAVLGLVIQMVSGEAYGTYIQQHIFAPLAMQESFTSQADARKHGLTAGYQTFFGAVLPVDAPYHLDIQPAGYLISSASDMTHYLIAQMNGGRYGTASVLSLADVEQMHIPEVVTHQNAGGNGAIQAQYAMGWFAGTLDGVPILDHGGDDINRHGDMIIIPGSDWGLIFFTNMGSLEGNLVGALPQTAEGVMHLLLGQPVPAGTDLFLVYLIIDGVTCLLTILVFWSLIRLLRRRQTSLKRQVGSLLRYLLVPLLWEWVLPIGLFVSIPKMLGGVSWIGIVLYLPDVGGFLLVLFCLLLLTGVLRCILTVLHLRRGEASREPNWLSGSGKKLNIS
jgi:CubicO group peptidase (beta-lactamase class C family)